MLRVADHWYKTKKLTNELTLIYEPHVHPFLRCNIWHLRGRDKDLIIDLVLFLKCVFLWGRRICLYL